MGGTQQSPSSVKKVVGVFVRFRRFMMGYFPNESMVHLLRPVGRTATNLKITVYGPMNVL
jgi:hypothetical protein